MSIDIRSVSKSYDDLIVLDDFSISLEDSMIHCLFGPSGCGKTTLLNIIAGLEEMDSGEIVYDKMKRISYIFQEERLLPWATAEENILFVLDDIYDQEDIKAQRDEKSKTDMDKNIIYEPVDYPDRKSMIRNRALEYMDLVGLSDFSHLLPSQLSGGMRQRVSIARALCCEPDILIMDEPFKGLDMKLKKQMMDYIREYMNIKKATVIFVTHELWEARYLGDIIYELIGLPLTLTKKAVINEY